MAPTFPLNPAQRAAVDHRGGPLLVVAGAGSGKTRVIATRIATLLQQSMPARAIIAVTFTNKAAGEMRERVAAMAGRGESKDVWISTFHALGAEMLRREAKHVAAGDRWVVYDAADSLGVVKEVLRSMRVPEKRYDAAAILARISHAKSAMTTPDRLDTTGEYDDITREVYPRYVARFERLHALDFDDLIGVPLRLLRENAEVRDRWHARVRHLLVDEFQDTNRAQLEMVKALCGPSVGAFCVGDDDQAIYGWRGADVRNVIEFPKHFPGAKVIALEHNYRSTMQILGVANAVIAPAVRAYPKVLRSDRADGAKVVLVECVDQESETKFALDTVREAAQRGTRRRDIGVLYRSNLLARPLEEAFRTAGIPYRLVGGTSFYERREVKDLTAYLRLALFPEDDLAFRRIVNYPPRGIGDTSFERLEAWARGKRVSLFAAAERAASITQLDERGRAAFGQFVGLVRAIREKLERNVPLADVARGAADAIGLRADVFDAGPTPQVAEKRWGNVEELYRMLARAEVASVADARQALARLSLRFTSEDEDAGDRVTVSTLHGAKGLEFDCVVLIGLDEGILPHGRFDAPKSTDVLATMDVSEERRLFYVGVTRARNQLFLVRARQRAGRGQLRATTPSRFLADIPIELIERRDYNAAPVLGMADLATQARAAREALEALRASSKR